MSIRSLSLSRNSSPNTASNTPQHLSRATAFTFSKPTSRDSTLTTSTPHAPTIWRPIISSMFPAQSSRKPSLGHISQIATLVMSPKPTLERRNIEAKALYKLQQLPTNQLKKMMKRYPIKLLKHSHQILQDCLPKPMYPPPPPSQLNKYLSTGQLTQALSSIKASAARATPSARPTPSQPWTPSTNTVSSSHSQCSRSLIV